MPVIFAQRLSDDGSPSSHDLRFFRLPPPVEHHPYLLRFIITAGSLASHDAALFTNYPVKHTHFARDTFHKVSFQGDAIQDQVAQFHIRNPGAYEYYVEYTDSASGERVRSQQDGFFLVDPRLYLTTDIVPSPGYSHQYTDKILLPLDGINILTVIPKWMPTIEHWLPFFRSFSNTGYNMVHLAPVNTRGISNSPYAIYDQLSLSDDLFEGKLAEDQKHLMFKETVEAIYQDCSILMITDMVWNHTACNSQWLQQHPESGYNLKTAPWLRSALELDDAILQFSEDLPSVYGCSNEVKTEEDIIKVISLFKDKAMPKIKLWEFYVVDVKTTLFEFEKTWLARTSETYDPLLYAKVQLAPLENWQRAQILAKDALTDDKTYMRFSKTMNLPICISFLEKLCNELHVHEEEQQMKLFQDLLNEINLKFYQEYDADVAIVVDQITNRARYIRVAEHGPRLGPITRHDPLVDTYFTRLPQNETTAKFHPDELSLANNGWIWNADPLVNFASEQSKAYLRREVIVWGDCVKLRYGDKPEDNPWLWKHQEEYTRKMAKLFHGFRIDNCHSTPIPVATYFLDVARSINPDLYVFAELFTGSEEKDIMFVSKLGINSLIREAMNAWDTTELGRQVHRQGGEPVGSFTLVPERFPLDILGHDLRTSFYQPIDEYSEFVVSVKGSKPHNLFMDCTHDNETPHQKRTAADSLPNAAVVSMANAAIGSVFGYDQIVPELLNVVTETRKYRVPDSSEGIIPFKSIAYLLHSKMAREGYSEIHVHTEGDFISVHRVHPITHEGYLMIVRTAFKNTNDTLHSPVVLKNQGAHVLESATLNVQTGGHFGQPFETQYESDPEDLKPPQTPTQLYHSFDFDDLEAAIEENKKKEQRKKKVVGVISGLPCSLEFSTSMSHVTHKFVETINENGDLQTVITVDAETFVPGSIVLYRTWMLGTEKDGDETPLLVSKSQRNSDVGLSLSTLISKSPVVEMETPFFDHLLKSIGFDKPNFAVNVMNRLGYGILEAGEPWFRDESIFWPPDLLDAVHDLDSRLVNIVLYRAGSEEGDTIGEGTYNIPGYGNLPYCGLQGFVSAMHFVKYNDLGHPLCNNLREGEWMLEYIYKRIAKFTTIFPALNKLQAWLEERMILVKRLPANVIPKYFITVVQIAYQAVKYRALSLHSESKIGIKARYKDRLSSLEKLGQACAMTTYQLYGSIKSTGLFPIVYPFDVYGPLQDKEVISEFRAPSLAAGLPHFATNHMRCWGRDIFISLPGLLLATNHFSAARAHIIAFGSTLKHGLIPNLLDQGIRPRYNARDACWFWLYSVAEYCRSSPEGYEFLNVKVGRRFIPLKRYMSGSNFCKPSNEPEEPFADDYIEPSHPKVYHYTSTIAELCQEILDRHAHGVSFREWNAGPNLDHAMRWDGFHVAVHTHWDDGTGFVHGGNRWNCGTWMDKMGDSEKAGIRGVPTTPRDGAAVEIIAILKATLRWIIEDVKASAGAKYWPWTGVTRLGTNGQEISVSYESWNKMIQSNFERFFYIPMDPKQDGKFGVERVELVRQRGIYKDTVGSSLPYMDYQLRPNLCIALVMAPELFHPDHARQVLKVVGAKLLGPLGLKTLDPEDPSYRGFYDNGNDSNDPHVAHGANYHQGPEWGWPLAFYLRAYLHFFGQTYPSGSKEREAAIRYVQRVLLKHKSFIFDTSVNPFAGLPELTNEAGAFCSGSCPTQAWSSSGIIEVVRDLFKLVS